jgi:hypothetical protein
MLPLVSVQQQNKIVQQSIFIGPCSNSYYANHTILNANTSDLKLDRFEVEFEDRSLKGVKFQNLSKIILNKKQDLRKLFESINFQDSQNIPLTRVGAADRKLNSKNEGSYNKGKNVSTRMVNRAKASKKLNLLMQLLFVLESRRLDKTLDEVVELYNSKDLNGYCKTQLTELVTLTYNPKDPASKSLVKTEDRLNEFYEEFRSNMKRHGFEDYAELLMSYIESNSDESAYHIHLQVFCPELVQNRPLLDKIIRKSWHAVSPNKPHTYVGTTTQYDNQAPILQILNYALKDNKAERFLKFSPIVSKSLLAQCEVKVRSKLSELTNLQLIGAFKEISGSKPEDVYILNMSKEIDTFQLYTDNYRTYTPNLVSSGFYKNYALRAKKALDAIKAIKDKASTMWNSLFSSKTTILSTITKWLDKLREIVDIPIPKRLDLLDLDDTAEVEFTT